MAQRSYDKLWRSEFYNNVITEDGLHDKNLNQVKLAVNGTYNKDEKIITTIEPSNDEDVVIKA